LRATIAESRSCCFAAVSRLPVAPASFAAFDAASATFFASASVFVFDRLLARRGVFAFDVVFDALFDVLLRPATRGSYDRPRSDTRATGPRRRADHRTVTTRATIILAGIASATQITGIVIAGHIIAGALA
jgi:hypothetical protein